MIDGRFSVVGVMKDSLVGGVPADQVIVSQLRGSELNIVATGLLLAVVLLFFPQGIVGTLKDSGKLPKFLDWD